MRNFLLFRYLGNRIPQFDISSAEHDPVKQPIKLPDTVDQDEPDDPSSPGSNPVCYFIVGGNSQGVFSLDPVQHTLKVKKMELCEGIFQFLKLFV